MKLCELPRLKHALDLMGIDNGADVHGDAAIPSEWEMRARLAKDELLQLTPQQVEDLVQGEEADQRFVAKDAPNADAILVAAFDSGELSNLFFEPWTSIYDARAAERRGAEKGTKP